MFHLDNDSGVSQMPKIPETLSQGIKWFTEGAYGDGVSYPGAHWFNIVQAELLNVLKEAGIEPDKQDLTQLAQALKVLSGQTESIASLRQFEPVRDRQVVFVKGYHEGSMVGGGYFIADFGDSSTSDNAGTVIVTSSGKRWKRIYSTLTPFDFGATADGVADDSAAFAALESVYFKQPIDLLGRTYVVAKKPDRNWYYNGQVKVDGRYQRAALPAYGVAWRKNCGEGFVIDELQPKVGTVASNSAGILQSIVYEMYGKHYYAISVKSGTLTSGDEQVVLTRYHRDGTSYLQSDVESLPSTKIGHQGLGLEYTESGIKLWASAGSYKYPDNGNYVVRFSPPNNGADITNIEEFKVWDTNKDNTRNYISNSVTISPQGDLMCVMGIWDAQQQARVRVFDMSVFDAGAGDYTDKWLYTWDIPDLYDGRTKPYQSITTDGKFVYILMGKDEMDVYTIDGHRVFKTQHTVGKNKCADLVKKGYTNGYEPESLLWMPTAGGFSLCVSVVMGYRWQDGSWSNNQARYKNLIFAQSPFEIITEQSAQTNNGLQTSGRIAALNNETAESGVFVYANTAAGRRIGHINSHSKGTNYGAAFTMYGLDDSSNAKGSIIASFPKHQDSGSPIKQETLWDAANSAFKPGTNNQLSLGLANAMWKEIFVATSDFNDKSHKVVNAAWVWHWLSQHQKGQNGFVKVGDIILQWAKGTSSETVGKLTLPIPFPHKLLFAVVTETKSDASGSLQYFSWILDESTPSEVAWRCSGNPGGYSVFAIGY